MQIIRRHHAHHSHGLEGRGDSHVERMSD